MTSDTPHILITQIQTSGGTSKTTQEFIEIYNQTPLNINLDTWKLVKYTAQATSTENQIVLVTFDEHNTIPPFSFFLIAHESYTESNSTTPNKLYSTNSIANNNTIALLDENNNVVDLVGFGNATLYEGIGTAPNPSTHASIQRTSTPINIFTDSNNNTNDFFKTISNPKNSSYLLETPTPTTTVSTTIPTTYHATITATTTQISTNESIILQAKLSPTTTETFTYLWKNELQTITTTDPTIVFSDNTPGTHTVFLEIYSDSTQIAQAQIDLQVYEKNKSEHYKNIRIHEVYSNPMTNENEWVELFNSGTTTVDLSYLQLSENSSTTTLSGMIAPQNYAVITFSNKLNNNGDIITLSDINGNKIHKIAYGDHVESIIDAPAKTQSIIFYDNDWHITISSTPGNTNIYIPIAQEHDSNTASTNETNTTTQSQHTEPEEKLITYNFEDIIISEIVASPDTDANEFVELYNMTDKDIPLDGWYLEDASGSKTMLTGNIQTGAYIIIYNPSGNLNNGGDTISLFDPTQTKIDELIYGNDQNPIPERGESLVRTQSNPTYVITSHITPGYANIITTQNTESTTSTEIIDTTVTNTPTQILNTPVIISEILPAPTEVDEFIELYNPTTIAQNISGLILDDDIDGSLPFVIPHETIIPANSYMVFTNSQTNLRLNNTKDAVRLINANHEILDIISYETTKTNHSLSKNTTQEWIWTNTPTPGEQNKFPEELANTTYETPENFMESNNSTNIEQNSVTPLFEHIPISEIHELSDGSIISTQGQVSALPGTLGAQIFYIQDETQGIQVYLYKKDFPDLLLGQTIEVIGTKTTSRGEARVKLASSNDIFVKAETHEEIPISITSIEGVLQETLIGSLIEVSGMTVGIKKNNFFLADSGAEIQVSRKLIPELDIQTASTTIRGILRKSGKNYILHPRIESDVIFVPNQSVITNANSTGTEKIQSKFISSTIESSDKTNQSPFAIFSGLFGFGGGIAAIQIKKKVLHLLEKKE